MSDSTPRDAAPSYRRRIALTAAGALGVVALVAATTALLDTDKTLRVVAPADGAPPAQAAPLEVPAGFRLVGFGDVAIEVPKSWGTNESRCGTPVKDTVEIDVGGVRDCLVPRPAGVETVSVFGGADFRKAYVIPGEPVIIGGRSAERTAATCTAQEDGVQICSASVRFLDEGIEFRAASSTSEAEVNAILDRIRVVPGFVGVPGFRDNQQQDQETSQLSYVAELHDAGFITEVRTERHPGMKGGFVLDAKPAPGTVARSGDTIVVTAVAPTRGPADEVYALMAATDADGGEGQRLDHDEIRAGATITMPAGGMLRVYGKGVDALTLGGDLEGTSLAPAPGRSGAVYWKGVESGTTRLTVTATRNGVRDVIGVVTVIVR